MVPIVIVSSTIVFLLISFVIVINKKNTSLQIRNTFTFLLASLIIWEVGILLRYSIGYNSNIPITVFDGIAFIGTALCPVFMFNLSRVFINSKLKYTKKDLLLFIIPIMTIILFYTNDYHQWFYTEYTRTTLSLSFWYYIHTIYTYALLVLGFFSLLRYSIRNSGFFSKASICICIAIILPVSLSASLGSNPDLYFFIVPTSLSVSSLLLMFALLRFDLLNITPIALQKIVDRISDSYLVINEHLNITDYNQTFVETFNNSVQNIRGKSFVFLLSQYNIEYNIIKKIESGIETANKNNEVISFDVEVKNINKFFTVEITAIDANKSRIGTLVLFKDITQHLLDMETIKESQDILMEKERLASLGQMIGGIAHNLKTPILSIAGTSEALIDLINEYNNSIEDPNVNFNDHHEIAKEMLGWIEKTKSYTAYMSDVITAVKGQAVALSGEDSNNFSVDELVKTITILMKHELKNALIDLDLSIAVSSSLELKGNINSLVQVVNNMISNAIQAYGGRQNEKIDLIVQKENDKLVISIKDYGPGLPNKVKEKLFKEMVTTKRQRRYWIRIIYVLLKYKGTF